MSTNLPPRRPTQPIIRGPRPVTTRPRPVGQAAEATPTPTAKPMASAPVIVEPSSNTSTNQQNTQAEPTKNLAGEINTATSAANAPNTTTNQVEQPKRITTKPTSKQPVKPKNNQDKSNVDPIKIILLLLVLMLGGVVGYLAYDKLKTNETLEANAESNENALLGLKTDIDLKVEELSKLQDSLRIVISEKEALGIALNNEKDRIAELETYKDQVQKKQLSINALNKKLNASRKEYENAQASVGNLAAENQRLVSEKVRLERLVQEKIDSIENLSVKQATTAAAPKPEKTVELKAESIMVIVYNTGGKEMKNPKAMMAGKIKASLNISAAYSNSEAGSSRDIYLRVIEPSGNTLYSGNKSFDADGKKVIYTEKQTIDFNNTKQRITFYYDKGSRYTPGRYTVEIWSDAKKIGQSEFVLQK